MRLTSQQQQQQHAISPALASAGHGHTHRQSLGSRDQQFQHQNPTTFPMNPTSPAAGVRYEELLAQREELEGLKRENDVLRRRIKELEVERRGGSLSIGGTGAGVVNGAGLGGRNEGGG